MYSTYAQFDRGSSINCISDKLVTLRGYKVQNVRPIMIKGLGGKEVSTQEWISQDSNRMITAN